MRRKTLYIDANALEEKISESIYKVGEICEILGISRQSFDKKRKGITAFLKSEVYVLCDLLKISEEDADKIFYPKSQPQS